MFKKRKNKTKQDILTVESKHQENKPPDFTAAPDENDNDKVDGFDSEGFVDLKPAEEQQTKLLGPKQNCQYIGTFAVSLGSGGDGEVTLTTHKERVRFVKKKLREYRYSQKGVDVALLISTDGIKVITPDGQRVRMAHALQRISFSTCDPEFCLFAYMSHNPSPMGTAIHCHVFIAKYARQVQNLTALVGKAFQVAFAESKFPKGAELKMAPLNLTDSGEREVQPGRRWAKLEARQGHEHSQHALLARMKKDQEKAQSPRVPREQMEPIESSVQTSSTLAQAQPFGRRTSFGKVHTPPQLRKADLLQRNGAGTEDVRQRTNLSDDVVTDSVIDGDMMVASRQQLGTSNANQQQVTEERIGTPDQSTQSFQAQRQEEYPLSSVSGVSGERSQTPPPSNSEKNSVAVPPQQSSVMLPLSKSISDPNLLIQAEGGNRHEAVSKRNSHEDENWYLPGIPREFVAEMLQNAEEGSFFVRDSQSRPGCFALTMRVPQEINPSGFGNYLIVKVKGGVMIQGFNKVFRDVTSLVEHYAQSSDGLPCKLLIGGSNVLCEDEEYMNLVPDDPDYQLLSDFAAMMAELK